MARINWKNFMLRENIPLMLTHHKQQQWKQLHQCFTMFFQSNIEINDWIRRFFIENLLFAVGTSVTDASIFTHQIAMQLIEACPNEIFSCFDIDLYNIQSLLFRVYQKWLRRVDSWEWMEQKNFQRSNKEIVNFWSPISFSREWKMRTTQQTTKIFERAALQCARVDRKANVYFIDTRKSRKKKKKILRQMKILRFVLSIYGIFFFLFCWAA